MSDSKETKSSNLIELLTVLVAHRRMIIINVVVITIVAAVVSLLLPNSYTAKVSFISPKKKGGLFGDIASFSNTIKDISKTLGGRLGNVTDEAYNYLVLLQSRSASIRVINKFELRKVYEIDERNPIENVLNELSDHVDFNIEDEGNIIISVKDKKPDRAAEIANFYVQVLNELSTELSISEAKNNRVFIEKRFLEVQNEIRKLEDSIQIFSERNHVFEIEEQIKSAISVASELRAKIESTKIERDLLKLKYAVDNPIILQADLEITEMEKRLRSLNFGDENSFRSSINFFIPFKKVPETAIKYLRLKRNFEIQTMLLEFIYPIYEQAKIEEQKDIPVILVVDEAIAPQKKSGPKRSLIVISALIISFLISSLIALINNSYKRLKSNEISYRKLKDGIIDPLKINFTKRSK
ncbi:MAG: hypothetical protein IPM56_02590 [Ignavibacteriales bacterium]|nr:MAG: hypothetical protein IPM56_02590 [Ignavibacteriales bacterium]